MFTSIMFSKTKILTPIYSYDSFKIFMGLPTTGGPMPEKKK
jgi:hypothetical protein